MSRRIFCVRFFRFTLIGEESGLKWTLFYPKIEKPVLLPFGYFASTGVGV